MTKICEICGAHFAAARSDSRFCSKKCRRVWDRRRMRDYMRDRRNGVEAPATAKCRYCGREFALLSPRQKYCSAACHAAKAKRAYLEELARKREANVERLKRICVVCGREFQAQRTTAKYCSKKCIIAAAAENARRRMRQHPELVRAQDRRYKEKANAGENRFRKSNGLDALVGMSRETMDFISAGVFGDLPPAD